MYRVGLLTTALGPARWGNWACWRGTGELLGRLAQGGNRDEARRLINAVEAIEQISLSRSKQRTPWRGSARRRRTTRRPGRRGRICQVGEEVHAARLVRGSGGRRKRARSKEASGGRTSQARSGLPMMGAMGVGRDSVVARSDDDDRNRGGMEGGRRDAKHQGRPWRVPVERETRGS